MVLILFESVEDSSIYLIIFNYCITNVYLIFPLQLRYCLAIVVNASTIMRLIQIVSLQVLCVHDAAVVLLTQQKTDQIFT